MLRTTQRTAERQARPGHVILYHATPRRNHPSVVGRGLLATKSTNWIVVLTGFVEPIFYLLSLGVGLGAYVGTVQDAAGTEIPYAAYIAPALLAVSAMNGAIYDSTWNVFFKMNFGKLYEGVQNERLDESRVL